MSRRAREEAPFGSDSFLDVLANIVGILIILIVTAAARVGGAPDHAPADADSAVRSQPASAPAPASVSDLKPVVAQAESESNEPPPEMAAEMNAMAKQLAALSEKSLAADAKMKKLETDFRMARQTLSDEEMDAAKRAGNLRAARLRVARLEEALGDRQQSLSGLLAEFEKVQNARAPAVEVRHRLAPISQEVAGEEIHFRVAGGRVSVVPLSTLVDRVKTHLERQKDWLASRGNHEAVVGPVDGYAMHYVVKKMALSTLERNRLGYGAYRIGISHWELVPEPDLAGETAEEAPRRGSKFALAVKTAPENAALTFWVYPDSFHAYRILQAACQAEGFVVAARPLPDGIRIAGSPDGTRSAGQ